MAKLTQKDKVLALLKEHGSVSRNFLIDNRTTVRLSSIIERLRKEGYSIETDTKSNVHDTVYRMEPKRVEHYIVPVTNEHITKNIWQ